MTSRTINIGILAHVDAGKTSLTERMLYERGAISSMGSVVDGTTTTDSGQIERERGITIRTAVAPFRVGDLQVNIIDTPGHPDFIAEVYRSLSVIDGAVLVVSAIEGVEAQTRVLMRSLSQTKIPTAIFINKIDQVGARPEEVINEIRSLLRLAVIPRNRVENSGTKKATVVPISWNNDNLLQQAAALADNDSNLLEFLVDGGLPTIELLSPLIQAQTANSLIHPVYFGSAVTGAGVLEITTELKILSKPMDLSLGEEKLHGRIFAIERGKRGEKIAYARIYSGNIHKRQKVGFSRYENNGEITKFDTAINSLEIVTPTDAHKKDRREEAPLTSGNIGKIIGPNSIKVGDYIGDGEVGRAMTNFAAPNLETIINPLYPKDSLKLNAALQRLVEEDPFIRSRQVKGGAMALLLYGEVQKEVIAERLLRDFGVEAIFEKAQPIYVERPVGKGRALHEMDHRGGPNRFFATIGLLVEPGTVGSGIVYENIGQTGHLPLAFHKAINETVHSTLTQGIYGWQVTDCKVSLTNAGYGSSVSTAADFRQLTPLIIMEALSKSGTSVFEPYNSFELEVPEDVFATVIAKLLTFDSEISNFEYIDSSVVIQGSIPTRSVQGFLGLLPGIARGLGVWLTYPGADQPVKGTIPVRPRTDGNPLNRDEYLLSLSGRNIGQKNRGLTP